MTKRLSLKPKRLAADTAYGNAPTLKTLVEQGIEPHIPIWDKSQLVLPGFSGQFKKIRLTAFRNQPG